MTENKPTPTENTPTTDQDTDGLKRALAAERDARKAAEKAARDATDRLADLEGKALRSQVAAAKGLSDEQAARLQGSTVEELEADADALLSAFKPDPKPGIVRKPSPDLKGGSDPTGDVETDYDTMAGKIVAGG